MGKLDDLIQTDNSFYSVRSDGSTMLAVKIQNVFASAQWMLIRTQPNKRVHSDHWVFSKLNGKDSVSFPVVATEELKQVARDGDFLEWQSGFAASAQSEQEIVLNKREQELVQTITTAREAFTQQEQNLQEKAQGFLTDLETKHLETKRVHEQYYKDAQEQLDQEKRMLEDRIQTFQSDLEERQHNITSTYNDVLAHVQEGRKQLQEQHDTSIQAVEQQSQQIQTLATTFQQSFDTKEQTLTHLVSTKTQELEEKIQTLRTDLEAQRPLSIEKHRQNTLQAASRLAIGLIIAGVAFIALTVWAAFLLSSNAQLIEIFGGICALLALIVAPLIAGISFLRPKNA